MLCSEEISPPGGNVALISVGVSLLSDTVPKGSLPIPGVRKPVPFVTRTVTSLRRLITTVSGGVTQIADMIALVRDPVTFVSTCVPLVRRRRIHLTSLVRGHSVITRSVLRTGDLDRTLGHWFHDPSSEMAPLHPHRSTSPAVTEQ